MLPYHHPYEDLVTQYPYSRRPQKRTYVLEEIGKLTVKTAQEKAAEESVAKAKEALKAAENALKTIKEKKE